MNSIETRPLPNAADKAALKAIATRVIQTCPSVQDTAHEVASNLLKKYAITGLDPDQVYFHRFDNAASSSKTFTGWEHTKPTSSMTLTQLVIHRFFATDQDNADLLDLYAGFYTAGPDASVFNETNEVRLHGNEVLKDFWRVDISSLYTERLTAYWNASGSDFRTLAQCNFLIKAVRARDKRQLSDEDFQFVTNAAMGPITWPVSLQMLQSQHPGSDGVRALDVAGYVSTNILRFLAPKGRQIVYLPGETKAFQVLETATDMHFWILQRMNKEDARQAFMTHFSLADRQDIDKNITDLMNRLVSTWGKYDHHLINQENRVIGGDAFTWLRDSTKDAMFAEAKLLLTSNGDLRKKLWIGYLSAGLRVFSPLAVVGWPVALPVIGASIANLGLNIDQAVNGKSPEERKAGILGAVFSGIDLLFALTALKGPGSLKDVGADIDAAEAKEMADLKEKTQPANVPETTPVEAPVEVPDTADPAIKVPQAYKIDVVLDDPTLVREPGKFQGIHQLPTNPSSAIKLNGSAYYVGYLSDINGGGTWAIVDPANPNAFSGSVPVRFNAAGNWEVAPRPGLRGGMVVPPVTDSGAISDPDVEEWARAPGYNVANLEDPEMRAWALGGPDVRGLLRTRIIRPIFGIDMRSVFMAPAEETLESISEFEMAQEQSRKDLISDANDFYAANPPLPRLPVTSTPLINTLTELLDSALAEKSGLVFGESRGSIGSKQLLIENMPGFAQRGVKTLYLQKLLANVNQLDLDTFARTGEMPEELENYLRKLDIAAGNDPEGRFNLLELVKAANAQRIRVQAIDMSTTYNINEATFNINENPDSGNPESQMARSYFAREVIQANEKMKGPAKWIALVDQEHMSSFRGYQGISEQTDALSVRIDDVTPGSAQPIGADPGLAVTYADYPDSPVHEEVGVFDDFGDIQERIKGDWRVQMQTPWATRTSREMRALLPEPGMFTFERYLSNVLVVYRNAEGEIAESAIRTTPGGRLNLDTPLRPPHDTMTVDSISELKQALIEKGMQLRGWPELAGEDEGATAMLEELAQVRPEVQRPPLPQHWQANELLEGMTPETSPGKFQGIYRLNGNPSTAIMLDDAAWYVRYEADVNGGGSWAIIDPANPHASSGSIPVRFNAQGEWEVTPKTGLKGGGNDPVDPVPGTSQSTAVPKPVSAIRTVTTPYDSEARLGRLALGKSETHAKFTRQPDGSLRGISLYEHYVAPRRTALMADASSYFSRTGFFASLPARPVQPVLTPTMTVREFLEKVFDSASGLVIGESQDRIASMRFLIENMPTLARQGVKTIYLHRLLNDVHQYDLEVFFNSKTESMTEEMNQYLGQLQSEPSGQYTPLEVIKAAKVNGIRIQATDCLASYRYPGSPLIDVQQQALKNFLTQTIINANEALNGPGKWVVVTDQENTNTFRSIAGISEMNGGIGLRIEEVLPEHSLNLEVDRGIDVGRNAGAGPANLRGDSDTLHADFSVQMPMPLLHRTPSQIAGLLFRQGMFTFEGSDGVWTLVHRSRTGHIVRTLIERSANGRYLINRPDWPDIHQTPYASLDDLSHALSHMGMRLEGRLPA